MSSKVLLKSFVMSLESVWDSGVDMMMLCNKQLPQKYVNQDNFLAALCVDRENVLMFFSNHERSYRLTYKISEEQLYLDDLPLLEGQYDREFSLSLAWFFDAYRRSQLLVTEAVFSSLKHKSYNLGDLSYISQTISKNMLDDLLTKHICVQDQLSLDPFLAIYPELNRYNFFDARFKLHNLMKQFDSSQALDQVYCSEKEQNLAVA